MFQEEHLQAANSQLDTTRAALQAAQSAEQAMLARATAAEDKARDLDMRCSDLQQESTHATYEMLLHGALWLHWGVPLILYIYHAADARDLTC